MAVVGAEPLAVPRLLPAAHQAVGRRHAPEDRAVERQEAVEASAVTLR